MMALLSVEALSDMLFRWHERPGDCLMLMVEAYFDESGTHQASEIVAVGGLLASTKRWRELEADWLKELAWLEDHGHKIKAFHSTECESGEGEFAFIPRDLREGYQRRLAAVIARHKPFVVWASVNRNDWNEQVNDNFLQKYPDPFDYCFDFCAYEISRWQREVGQNCPVSMVYSQQDEYEKRAQAIWRAYNRACGIAQFNSFTVGSYKTFIPLQAADMVAAETYRHWLNGGSQFRPASSVLMTPTTDIEMTGHHGADTLRLAINRVCRGLPLVEV